MSDNGITPTRYEVEYSGVIRDLLIKLGRQAQRRGDGPRFLTALREFHERLSVYPQFGDPLQNLFAQVGQTRIGIISPLVMRYGVLEEHRRVIVSGAVLLSGVK